MFTVNPLLWFGSDAGVPVYLNSYTAVVLGIKSSGAVSLKIRILCVPLNVSVCINVPFLYTKNVYVNDVELLGLSKISTHIRFIRLFAQNVLLSSLVFVSASGRQNQLVSAAIAAASDVFLFSNSIRTTLRLAH